MRDLDRIVIPAGPDPPSVTGTARLNSGAFTYYARLARVRTYVEEHLAEPIPLSAAARVAGMERTYFSSFFHDKTGVCFRDWLSMVRVCRTATLLQRGNLSVRRAAFEAGFSSLRTCERAFAKMAHRPPRDFKKAAQAAMEKPLSQSPQELSARRQAALVHSPAESSLDTQRAPDRRRTRMTEAARLRSLKRTDNASLADVFQTFAEELGNESQVVIQFRVVEGDESRTWVVSPGEGGSRAASAEVRRPDLELIASEETFDRIGRGDFSPVDAFREGNMRIRGDHDLAKRILDDLAAPSE